MIGIYKEQEITTKNLSSSVSWREEIQRTSCLGVCMSTKDRGVTSSSPSRRRGECHLRMWVWSCASPKCEVVLVWTSHRQQYPHQLTTQVFHFRGELYMLENSINVHQQLYYSTCILYSEEIHLCWWHCNSNNTRDYIWWCKIFCRTRTNLFWCWQTLLGKTQGTFSVSWKMPGES